LLELALKLLRIHQQAGLEDGHVVLDETFAPLCDLRHKELHVLAVVQYVAFNVCLEDGHVVVNHFCQSRKNGETESG
jgi:hypothetical protein